ncbi:uncharacterized protein [Leptinotarsa decemlineata]|uniref:uncharacterized protein n=1 Tax=Leptinotarsa decemlineata TaxID=7539 RepID=UPI003D306A29
MLVNDNHYRKVKSDSVLNRLTHFHVCSPGLPPCLGHDIFEGVVQYDVMLVLNYLIKKNNCSIETLNICLHNLKVNDISVNFPPFEEKNERLLGSAHENLLLIQLIPFVIVNLLTDLEDPVWQMLLLLRKICGILLSAKLSVGQVFHLKYMMNQYITERLQLFPEIPLRPKHHYLLHYPHLIIQFGPLKYLWTLHFESKHIYFKTIVKHCPNFRNILLSLSEKHQLLQALQAHQPNVYEDKIISDKVVHYESKYYSHTFQILLVVFVSEYVCYRGTIYKKSSFLCYGQDQYGDFFILDLKNIIIDKNYTKLLFIGQSFTICYDNCLGLYNKLSDGKLEACLHLIVTCSQVKKFAERRRKLFIYS